MIHIKDSLLPRGKVWYLDFLGIPILMILDESFLRTVLSERPWIATENSHGSGTVVGNGKIQSLSFTHSIQSVEITLQFAKCSSDAVVWTIVPAVNNL